MSVLLSTRAVTIRWDPVSNDGKKSGSHKVIPSLCKMHRFPPPPFTLPHHHQNHQKCIKGRSQSDPMPDICLLLSGSVTVTCASINWCCLMCTVRYLILHYCCHSLQVWCTLLFSSFSFASDHIHQFDYSPIIVLHKCVLYLCVALLPASVPVLVKGGCMIFCMCAMHVL